MDLIDIFEDIPAEEFAAAPVASLEEVARELKEDFIDYLEHGYEEPDREPGLHCSSLWKVCARARVLEAIHAESLPAPSRPNAGERMTFDEGHALHHLIQNGYGQWGRIIGDWKCLHCQKVVFTGKQPTSCPDCRVSYRDADTGAYNLVYKETRVEDPVLGYMGHRDGLILDRRGKKRGFEFKSISKSQFAGLKEPKWAHVIQATSYMATEDYDEYVIWYWDKASQADWTQIDGRWSSTNPHIKIFVIPFNEALWSRMEARIRDYHAAGKLIEEAEEGSLTGTEFPRICPARSCDLAGECAVRDFCFPRSR